MDRNFHRTFLIVILYHMAPYIGESELNASGLNKLPVETLPTDRSLSLIF